MCGIARSSQRGSHQLASPISAIVEGTRIIRTMVASTNTATVNPTANILTSTSDDSRNAANTLIMMSAADVITLAVAASPSTTLRWLSPVRTNSSRTRLSRNTS